MLKNICCNKCNKIINNFIKKHNFNDELNIKILKEYNNDLQEMINEEIIHWKYENTFIANNIITYEELNNLYKQYCKNLDNDFNINNKLIINRLINKLNFTDNIKCINCNELLENLSNNILNTIDITNDNYIKKFNICKKCKLIYNNNICDLCDDKLNINFNYEKLKFYNNKYYHLNCYNDNINCQICNLKTNNFEMHDLCYKVCEILNTKCLECNKNILNNNDFKYIDKNQLNEIINNYNNNFIIIIILLIIIIILLIIIIIIYM